VKDSLLFKISTTKLENLNPQHCFKMCILGSSATKVVGPWTPLMNT